MANIKSSKKAIKVIAKKTEANVEYKARVKNSIKAADKAMLVMIKKKLQSKLRNYKRILIKLLAKESLKRILQLEKNLD